MPWRYQPVYDEDEGDPAYTLVEVHFDDDGNFKWKHVRRGVG